MWTYVTAHTNGYTYNLIDDISKYLDFQVKMKVNLLKRVVLFTKQTSSSTFLNCGTK